MPDYVDRSTQTTIAGLTRCPSDHPPQLSNTPQHHLNLRTARARASAYDCTSNNSSESESSAEAMSSKFVSQDDQRPRPPLLVRNSEPLSEFDAQAPHSPPPTKLAMSPLPPANLLHAGHTPIIPRARSPEGAREQHTGSSSPGHDEGLQGPLTLPARPGDGSAENIDVQILHEELAKIAEAQKLLSPASPPTLTGAGEGQADSPELRRHSSTDEVEAVDGVILKKPRMNMGAPLGQAS